MSELNKLLERIPLIVPMGAIRPLPERPGHEVVDLRSIGMVPGFEGGVTGRGINVAGDVVTRTVDGRDLNQIWSEYQAALALYNAQRDALMRVLTFTVSNPVEDVFQGGDTVDFEEASELGLPRTVRSPVPTYFSLGYTFKWYDIGIAFSWMFLAEATNQQVDSLNNKILEGDNRLVFTQVMKAIFNNVTRAATIAGQNYNVYPFYNNDATVPPKYKFTQPASPHQHYLVSGGATVDPGDLTGTGSMEAHLTHHGYSWQNGSVLILLVNSAQMATIRTFRFGTASAEYDFVPSQGLPAWFIPTDLQLSLSFQPGAAPPPSIFGLPIQGRYGPWLVVEEDLIPAGYMLGLASGGSENAANPVGIREHINRSLRGLRLVKGQVPDYPLVDSYYQRGFGTGIRQRGAGVMMQIKASGSYDIPAAYV